VTSLIARLHLPARVADEAKPVKEHLMPRRLPWTVEDLLRTYLGNAVGLVAVLTSWYGVSGTAVPERSVRWLVIGIGGVITIGTVNGLWLLAGRRAVGERTALVTRGVEQLLPALSAVGPRPVVTNELSEFVAVTGGTRYHTPDCQLVAGKTVVHGEQALADRLPCGVCTP
jgi:hypothetical protein